MNPQQGDRRTIIEGIQYPFGVTAYGKNIYYTDWKRYGSSQYVMFIYTRTFNEWPILEQFSYIRRILKYAS